LKSNPRPKIVTWLAVIVLIFSAGQFAGIVAWFSLPELSLTVPRSYLLGKNLIWASISLVAGASLFLRWKWAIALTTWGAIAYAAFVIFDLFVLRSSEFALQARNFNLVATLVILSIILWAANRPNVQSYFRRNAG
jgi:hypothetical protein